MTPVRKTIDHGALRRLVDAGAPIGAEVVGTAGGWGVVISYGRSMQTLAVTRGEARTFRKFETLAGYLKDLGITDLRVRTSEFTPGGDGPTDKRGELASARMKRAHEAAAHDKWFRAQVEEALVEADSPGAAPSIPHEVVKAQMARQRASLKARIAKVR